MNIFIDTSVIYKDPFWKGNFFSELIELVEEKEIGLFISDVVLMEITRNYGKIIDQEIFELKKLNSNIQHYNLSIDQTTSIDREKSIVELKKHYKSLEEKGTLKVLKYYNDMLPDILQRAVERRKPFTEKKTELKDTLIWLTYSKFAEENKLDNCIFLTENVTDFCDHDKMKSGIFEIHNELKKDSTRFKVYKSPKEIIQNEKNTLQSISQRFGKWLAQQEINDEFVLGLIQEFFENEVKDKVEKEFEFLDLENVFSAEYYLDGYVTTGWIDILSTDDIEIDTFNEECIISGQVYLDCDVEGYQYMPVRDKGEDRYRFFGERTVRTVLTFSFYYDRSKIPHSIDLDDFEIW